MRLDATANRRGFFGIGAKAAAPACGGDAPRTPRHCAGGRTPVRRRRLRRVGSRGRRRRRRAIGEDSASAPRPGRLTRVRLATWTGSGADEPNLRDLRVRERAPAAAATFLGAGAGAAWASECRFSPARAEAAGPGHRRAGVTPTSDATWSDAFFGWRDASIAGFARRAGSRERPARQPCGHSSSRRTSA